MPVGRWVEQPGEACAQNGAHHARGHADEQGLSQRGLKDGSSGPSERAHSSDFNPAASHRRERSIGQEQRRDHEHEHEERQTLSVKRLKNDDGDPFLHPPLLDDQRRPPTLALGKLHLDHRRGGAGRDVDPEPGVQVDRLRHAAHPLTTHRIRSLDAGYPYPDHADRCGGVRSREDPRVQEGPGTLECGQQHRWLRDIAPDVHRRPQLPAGQSCRDRPLRHVDRRGKVRLERNRRTRSKGREQLRIEAAHHAEPGPRIHAARQRRRRRIHAERAKLDVVILRRWCKKRVQEDALPHRCRVVDRRGSESPSWQSAVRDRRGLPIGLERGKSLNPGGFGKHAIVNALQVEGLRPEGRTLQTVEEGPRPC